MTAPNTIFVWGWSRDPGGRTAGELQGLINMLSGYAFDLGNEDKWKWTLASNGRFTVNSLSSQLDERILSGITSSHETYRNSLVPKKFEIFAWRVLKKRIRVRLKLDKQGIDLHSVRCSICDDDLESVDHCLISCKYSMEVWNRVYSWWKIGSFSNLSIGEILRGNAPIPLTNFGRLIWQAVECVCAYYNWKNRNNLVFRGKSWTIPVMLNEIQSKSFEWISQRLRKKIFNWHAWLSDPYIYL
ncbi:uncharacterized protein [Rutidosis leptorrhynchoides]|uniref:uncharacterized protein n=1 Tax=Rutidosis leptorrhynchoides TaxID=125765 RepID=UPI003A98D9C8